MNSPPVFALFSCLGGAEVPSLTLVFLSHWLPLFGLDVVFQPIWVREIAGVTFRPLLLGVFWILPWGPPALDGLQLSFKGQNLLLID